MKVAILGAGIRGIEAAVEFKKLGAEVHLISENLGGIYAQFPELPLSCSWKEITSLPVESQLSPQRFGDIWNECLQPLIKKHQLEKNWKKRTLLRVQKSFLSPASEVEGRSRMVDTFRVIFKEEPDVTNEELKKDKRLKESFESYLDADIVLEALGTWKNPLPTSPTGEALGESKTNILYGAQALKELLGGKQGGKSLVLGNGWMCFLALKTLLPNLLESHEHEILWAAGDEKEFFSLLQKEDIFDTFSKESLQSIGKTMKQWMSEQQNLFENQLREWRNEKKGEQPKEPHPPLQKLLGYIPLSFDHHTGQDDIFVTFERNPHIENSREYPALLTRSFDRVYCLTGHTRAKNLFSFLRCRWSDDGKQAHNPLGLHPEPGFYSFWNSSQFDAIKENAMTYFSRRDD